MVELTEEQKNFLEQCEEEFKERYTEKDKEFMKIKLSEPQKPPIVDPWNNKPARSNNWNRQNQRDNRYNRNNQGYRDRERERGDRSRERDSHYTNRYAPRRYREY